MIYVLDTDLNVLSLLVNAGPDACPYFDDLLKETIADGALTYEFTTLGDHEASSYLSSTGYIMRANLRGELLLFKIRSIREQKQADGRIFKTVFCENAALELIHDVVRPTFLTNAAPETALTRILQGTEWQRGNVEWLGLYDFDFTSYPTVLNAVQQINETTGGEIVFRVELENGRVTGKYIDLLQRRGQKGMFRFDYRHDLQEVERTEDSSFLVTALIGVGKSDNGRNPVTMVGVEYTGTLPDGTKVYKSPNQDYVENPEAMQRYGTRGRHKYGVFKTEETDRLALIKRTWNELLTYSEPQLQYSVKVAVLSRLSGSEFSHKHYELGDGGDVIDHTFRPSLMVSARIIEREVSFTDPSRDTVMLGNFIRYQPTTIEIIEQLQDTIRENVGVWESGGEMIHKSPSPPDFPQDLDLWLDTSQEPHILKKYDAASGSWINASPTEPGDIGAISPGEAEDILGDMVEKSEAALRDFIQQNYRSTITQQQTPPASPAENDLWIDISKKPHIWKRWDGTAWVNASATSLDELAGQLKTGQIERGSVTEDLLAAAAISAGKIKPGAITSEKLAEGAVEIGGRNYAQRTNEQAWNSYYTSNVTFLTNDQGRLSIRVGYISGTVWGVQQIGAGQTMQLEKGKQYTISFDAKGTPGLPINYVYIMNMGASNEMVSMKGQPLTEENYTRYTGTFTKQFDAAKSYVMVSNRGDGAEGAYFEIKNVKVEGGNRATDWQPSPEDSAAKTTTEINTAIDPVNDRITLWAYEDTTLIDGGSIYANSITANQIAAGAIIADKIAANAITSEKIAAGAVTADSIAAGSITSTMIAVQGLDAGVIKFGTMSGSRIMTNTLDANVLKSGTVIANDIKFSGILSGASGTFSGSVVVGSETSVYGLTTLQSGYLENKVTSGTEQHRARLSTGRLQFWYVNNSGSYVLSYTSSLSQTPNGLEVEGAFHANGTTFGESSLRMAPYGPLIIDTSTASQGTQLQNSRSLYQYGAAYFYDSATFSGSSSGITFNTNFVNITPSGTVTINPSGYFYISGGSNRYLSVDRYSTFSQFAAFNSTTQFNGSATFYSSVNLRSTTVLGGTTYFGGTKIIDSGEFISSIAERGYCGVGGVAGGSSNVAGVGVNYRVKKNYTPSYISLSATSSTATAYTTDHSNEGFFLYITKPAGTNNNLYYFWRGYYSA